MKRDGNFGDLLTPLVLRHLGYTASYVPWKTPGKLMAVGTLLPLLQPGDVVWGTGGYLRPGVRCIHQPGVTYLAVRGPLTRSIIDGDVPEIYGDPGLLLPQFIPPASEKKYDVGVIPHMVEKKDVSPINDPAVLWIDIQSGVRRVVEQITQCRTIIASCLHGIVAAEAYGIPAAWVRMSDRIRAGSFKYNDYYLSTGRDTREPVIWNGRPGPALKAVAPPIEFNPLPLIRALQGWAGNPQ